MGDQFSLKPQSCVRTTVVNPPYSKLAYKFFGPFTVTERIGMLAYRLNLPPDNRIHPVFHVSMLRRVLNSGMPVETRLPHCSDELAVPMAVLQSRWKQEKGKMREQVLIRWSNSNVLGDTWEDKAGLKERFLLAEAWGQASSQGGGDVSTLSKPGEGSGSSAAATADPATPAGGNAKWTNQGEGRVIAKPTRIKHPNRRFVGPEWVSST